MSLALFQRGVKMGGLLRDSALCRLCSGDSGGGGAQGEGGVQERGCDAFAELLVLAWSEVTIGFHRNKDVKYILNES